MKRKIYKLLSSAKRGVFALVLTVFSGTAYSQATYTLNFTGSVQTLTLPVGIWGIECWGANGGDVTSGPGGGGKGGYSQGTFNVVTAGTVLNILVGGKGVSASGTGSPAGPAVGMVVVVVALQVNQAAAVAVLQMFASVD